ncbi:MAG: hypothetical protein D6780_04675 [Candidatus Dadabacteria bacterium]|nr:MAG: hypothetical protein D6780_04675 [Candidatus Dadabacteria bacterium]
MRKNYFVFIILCLWLLPFNSLAQSRTVNVFPKDSRGDVEAVLCTQNLNNWGLYKDVVRANSSITPALYKRKEEGLIARFLKAKCDIIGVQEVLGKDLQTAKKALSVLADGLHLATGRMWQGVVSKSNDKRSRVGLLFAQDTAKLLNFLSYADVLLPKLSQHQKPRFFARGPLEVHLKVKGKEGKKSKVIVVITFHFKSKRGGKNDPAGLMFETWRMEMAEALRRIVLNRHKSNIESGRTLVVLMGDRNSNFDTASAKILEGVLTLSHFQKSAPCRISMRGAPLCQAGSWRSPQFVSVLTTDPETKQLPGTYQYKKTYSWIDDILLPPTALPFTWESPTKRGNYASGVIYTPKSASDHALAYVQLNW